MVETHEPQSGPPRILAVDDEPNALSTIRKLLESYGCEVESTADPDDALRLAQNSIFDAVVIDQILPGQTGLEVLREIRKVRKDQAAIIISGVEPTNDLKLEMGQLGAIFVRKSNLNDLMGRLKMLLEQERHPVSIFVSYTSPDFEKVAWIYYRLLDNGFAPWMDKHEIPPGYAWDKEIEKVIGESDFVLSCLSDIAVRRRSHFEIETRLAVARHDLVGEPFIIPLLLDDCEMPPEFVERNIQHISYTPFHGEWWELLLKTLRSKTRY